MKGAEYEYNYLVVDAPLHGKRVEVSKHSRNALAIVSLDAHNDPGGRVPHNLQLVYLSLLLELFVCFASLSTENISLLPG